MPRYFNGLNEYLTAAALSAHQITGDVSIAVTFNPDTLPASNAAEWAVFQSIGGETTATNALYGVGIRNNSGTSYFSFFHESGSGVNHRVDSNITVSADTEYKIIVIRNTSALTYQLIVNGTDHGTFSYTTNPSGGSSTRLRIGSAYSGGTSAAQWFNGTISEVGIWDAGISTAEAISYTDGSYEVKNIDTSNLVSHYRITGGISPEPDTFGSVGSLVISGTPNSPVITTQTSITPNLTNNSKQGYARSGVFNIISDNESLYIRDSQWSVIASDTAVLSALTSVTNHLGDIDVYNGMIYTVANRFSTCADKTNHQIAIYNASTLALTSSRSISASDHTAAAAIAINHRANEIYLGSFCDGANIEIHDLDTLAYSSSLTLSYNVSSIQGIAYKNGYIYAMGTDGDLFQIRRSDGDIIWHENMGGGYPEYEGIDFSGDEFRYLVHASSIVYNILFITGVPVGNIDFNVTGSKHLHKADSTNVSVITDSTINLDVLDSKHIHKSDIFNIVQTYNLNILDSKHSHKADKTNLSLTVDLDTKDSKHTHKSDKVNLNQTHDLNTLDSKHINKSDNLIIDQIHNLNALDSKHLHKSDKTNLDQTNNLIIFDSKHIHKSDKSNLDQTHYLNIIDSKHLHKSDETLFNLTITLNTLDSKHIHKSENNAVDQTHNINVLDSKHLHKSDIAGLEVTEGLDVRDSKHLHKSDKTNLDQIHDLGVLDNTHNHTSEQTSFNLTVELNTKDSKHIHKSDNTAIDQIHNLNALDSKHTHTSDNAALESTVGLQVNDSKHLHKSDKTNLDQVHNLSVKSTKHIHKSENVVIQSTLELDVHDNKHLHKSENAGLIQTLTLSIKSAKHIHKSDNAQVNQTNILRALDGKHLHKSDKANIVQKHILKPKDAKHLHKSDFIDWTPAVPYVSSPERTILGKYEDRTIYSKYVSRVIQS